jgi:hypothetical protein
MMTVSLEYTTTIVATLSSRLNFCRAPLKVFCGQDSAFPYYRIGCLLGEFAVPCSERPKTLYIFGFISRGIADQYRIVIWQFSIPFQRTQD